MDDGASLGRAWEPRGKARVAHRSPSFTPPAEQAVHVAALLVGEPRQSEQQIAQAIELGEGGSAAPARLASSPCSHAKAPTCSSAAVLNSAAFLAAFVVYESLVAVATGPGVDHFTAPGVTRIFFINLAAFATLLLKAAGTAAAIRDVTKTLAPRPIKTIGNGGILRISCRQRLRVLGLAKSL